MKAKNSETISLTTAGTVMDVFVEGASRWSRGDPLFTIDFNAATEVQKARDEVRATRSRSTPCKSDIARLNLSPSYAGKADGRGDPEPRR